MRTHNLIRISSQTFFLFVLGMLLLVPGGKLSAEELGYELKDGTLTILMYGGFADWKKATESDKNSVTRICIDEGVPVIPNQIFSDMLRVESVEIPTSVTMIGAAAFWKCQSLSSVTFAEGSHLKRIGGYAFYRTDISSITIPSSVERIGKAAFRECSGLKSVQFAENSQLKTIGEWAFYETALMAIHIPNSLTTLEKAAFEGCRKLSSVTFAKDLNLKTISSGAFSRTALTSIKIPASVTMIEAGAFKHCKRLSSVIFAGTNLKTIGEWAFSETAFTSFSIPASVTTIGAAAFAKTPLKTVFVPSSVKTIEGAAFTDCSRLAEVIFDDGSELEKIGTGGFYGTALASVDIPFSVKTIGAGSFSHTALKSVTIPASVTDIERSAFSQTSLTSVTIPSSVKAIGKEAFYSCPKLIDVTFLSSKAPARFEENVFGGCYLLESIYIPEGSTGYSGGNWTKYKDQIKRKLMSTSSSSLTTLSNLFSWGEMGSLTLFNPLVCGVFVLLWVFKWI